MPQALNPSVVFATAGGLEQSALRVNCETWKPDPCNIWQWRSSWNVEQGPCKTCLPHYHPPLLWLQVKSLWHMLEVLWIWGQFLFLNWAYLPQRLNHHHTSSIIWVDILYPQVWRPSNRGWKNLCGSITDLFYKSLSTHWSRARLALQSQSCLFVCSFVRLPPDPLPALVGNN